MKVTVKKFDNSYEIHLTPETLAETAILVDAATNSTKELKGCDAYITSENVQLSVWVGRRKQPTCRIRNVQDTKK